jgi:hypothetical protein
MYAFYVSFRWKGQSLEKECAIITLNDILGPNLGSPTVFKIFKPPV